MKTIGSIVIPLLVLLAALGGSVTLQHQMIENWRQEPKRFRDTLYLPSSDYVRVISVGYNQFTADYLWLRMIQVFGASYSLAEAPMQLYNYADKITDLDPHFADAYTFALMGLSEGRANAMVAEQSEGRIKDPYGTPFLKVSEVDKLVTQLVDKAIVKQPGDYRAAFDGACYAYSQLNNLPLAKYYTHMARTDPDYPSYIDSYEGYFELKQGRFLAAYEKGLRDEIGSIRSKNKDLLPTRRIQLNRAINKWFINEIKQRALEWQKTHGQLPTVDELRRAGAFKGVTLPDVRRLDTALKGMIDGSINPNLSEAEITDLLKKTTRSDWTDLPPGPYDAIDPQYQGYVIWRAKKPEDANFVLSSLEAVRVTYGFIKDTLDILKSYPARHAAYPPTLGPFEKDITKTDPFGNPWVYDPQAGTLKSATYPNLDQREPPDPGMKQ